MAQNKPSATAPDNDTSELKELGLAQVRSLDFDRLIGAGILHTKLWVVDSKHLFVGSANMDWRSLTQVPIALTLTYRATNKKKLHNRLKRLVLLSMTAHA